MSPTQVATVGSALPSPAGLLSRPRNLAPVPVGRSRNLAPAFGSPSALRAISADSRLLDRSQSVAPIASVHSIFDRAVNLISPSGHDLLTLACAGTPNAPGTVVVDLPHWAGIQLRHGDIVVRDGDTIRAPGFVIGLAGAVPWAPSLPTLSEPSPHVPAGYALVRAAGARGGVLPHITECAVSRETNDRLCRAILGLRHALLSRHAEAAESWGRQMLGLGPGLTPAGDDFLTGLAVVSALAGGPLYTSRSIFVSLAEIAASASTTISHAALAHAAQGRAPEPICALVSAMAGADWQAAEQATRRVLDIGHTSGSDIAMGVLAGLDIDRRLREVTP